MADAHFFISYTSADCDWAEWIAWQLEAAGYTTVIQAWDFRPGGNFVVAMQRAAAESERTIAVLSPAYLQSGYTAAEWGAAFARDPTGTQGLLLPVRIQVCEPEGLLPQIVYIDLLGLDEGAAKAKLLKGVQRRRAKPTTAPDFPGAGPSRPSPPFPPAAIATDVGLPPTPPKPIEPHWQAKLVSKTWRKRTIDLSLNDAQHQLKHQVEFRHSLFRDSVLTINGETVESFKEPLTDSRFKSDFTLPNGTKGSIEGYITLKDEIIDFRVRINGYLLYSEDT